MVGLSPSSSEMVAEQVSEVAVVIPVLGVIVAPDTLGIRFSMVVLVESCTLSPSPSVAETEHVTTSLGVAPIEFKSSVEPLPTIVFPIDHS